MISGPSYHKTKLKFIQLSRVEANKLLVVVVVEGNIIKNTMIDIGEDLGEQELLNLNNPKFNKHTEREVVIWQDRRRKQKIKPSDRA